MDRKDGYVFEICYFLEDCKVKFTTCSLVDASMSWWTSYMKTIDINVANAMDWSELKQLMIEEYCPHEEMQKLDQEL